MDAMDKLAELGLTWGLKVVGGVAVLIVGIIVARVGRAASRQGLGMARLDQSLVSILSSAVFYLIITVVAIVFFGVVGIETASLITILGASGLAIGLALQGSLSNFASGVVLLSTRPYRAGDFIATGDFSGSVAEIGMLSTKLDTLDNMRVVIPNTYVAERPLANWSVNQTRRIDLSLEISIGSDLSAVQEAILKALRAERRVLREPQPEVAVSDFGDTSARLVVRPWCHPRDYWSLRYGLPERVKETVEAAGGTLPTPQRQIMLQNPPSAPG